MDKEVIHSCDNCGYKFTSSMFNGEACGRTNDFLPEDRCCIGWKQNIESTPIDYVRKQSNVSG